MRETIIRSRFVHERATVLRDPGDALLTARSGLVEDPGAMNGDLGLEAQRSVRPFAAKLIVSALEDLSLPHRCRRYELALEWVLDRFMCGCRYEAAGDMSFRDACRAIGVDHRSAMKKLLEMAPVPSVEPCGTKSLGERVLPGPAEIIAKLR